MTFSLEAVFALHGDALILHYGPTDPHPNWILIDGGARGTYRNFLEPRLKQLKEDWQIDGSIPLQMVMVSHIDSDHIAGVLDLFKNLKDNRQTPLCEVGNLWHNSFDDVIGNEDEELISKLVKPPGGVPVADDDDMDVRETEAVAASVGQGRDLRLDAEAIGITTNSPFEGRSASKPALVLANSEEIPQGHGLTFQVLAPDINRVKTYQEKWNKYLKEKGLEEVEASAFNDPSAFNLASIVVLARMGGHEMLLTGDARGDYIVNGLVEAGLLDSDAAYPERQEGQKKREWRKSIEDAEKKDVTPFHVDLLKIPHHGSANNVTVGFFRRVTADHYLFSGNGNHHNPDPETLQMLADARGDDNYTMHFTFTNDQHETETNAKFAAALAEVHEWIETKKPANCEVVHRDKGDDIYSISVDLSDDE